MEAKLLSFSTVLDFLDPPLLVESVVHQGDLCVVAHGDFLVLGVGNDDDVGTPGLSF